MHTVAHSPISLYLEAARPKTLIASLSPILIALSMSQFSSTLSVMTALSTLMFGLLIQIATNYFNDAYDWKKGADTPDRKGPRRLVSSGLISFEAMRQAAIFCLIAATPFALLLIYQGGFVVATLCLLASFLAFGYTAGPKPLAYMGLGDITVWVFFGPIATGGVFYLVNGYLFSPALWMGIIPAALSCQLLAINNTRDYEQDKKAHKKTVPVRFGQIVGKWQVISCPLSAALTLIGFNSLYKPSLWFVAAALMLLLSAAWFSNKLIYKPVKDFKPLFVHCTMVLWATTILTSLGLLL